MACREGPFMIFWLSAIMCLTRGDNFDIYYGSPTPNNTDRNYHSSMLCMDLRPQKSVDLTEMMGMWYGVEIVVHNRDIPGTFKYQSCVQVHLSDVTDQMPSNFGRDEFYNANYNNNNNNMYRPSIGVTERYYNAPQQQQQPQPPSQTPPLVLYNNRMQSSFQNIYDPHIRHSNNNNDNDWNTLAVTPKYLQLIWSEKIDKNLEYIFNYTDNNPGIWTNVRPQRGSMAIPNQYTQFTGTVQVVKAVSDHVVLTFCNNNVKSSIYTIVLSRNRWGLSEDVKRSIRSMLFSRGLSTDTIRQVCISAAPKASLSTALLFAVLLSFLWCKKSNF